MITLSIIISLSVALASCSVAQPSPQADRLAYAAVPGGKAFQNEFLQKVNAIRKSGCKCGNLYMAPAPVLTWNSNLEAAASNHAQDMFRNKYFDHVSRKGKTVKDRIEAAGYSLKDLQSYAFGENIAAGQRSINHAMESWIKSPGHCKNLMNPDFKEIGVAQYNYYWVQNFGMRKSFAKKDRSG